MINKKVLFFLPILILLTIAFSYFFSNKVKTEVQSEEGMYYNVTHNPAFPKVDGTIRDMALSADGSILYVAGEFSHIGDIGGAGGVARSNLAAVNMSDFSITSWAPVADDAVYTIEVYGDSIYVGGSFFSIGETTTGEFAKINTNGSPDSSCPVIYVDAGTPSTVYDVEINSQYIYVGGSFNRVVGGNTVYGLARLNKSDCSWDSGYVPVLDDAVYDIELYDGGIYIGGGFKNVNATPTGEFAKLNTDGSVNSNCTPNIHTYMASDTDTVHEITLTDDYIYVGGSFDFVGENQVSGLVRLSNENNCTWDSTWVPESNGTVNMITPIGNDLLVGGSFSSIGSLQGTQAAIVYGDTGGVSTTWNPRITYYGGITFTVYSSVLQNNKIIVGGSFNMVEGVWYEGGSGLAQFAYSYEEIPTIEIDTIEELNNIGNNLFINYVLTRDLDFGDCSSYADCDNMEEYTTGEGWEPIGSYEEPFLGKFNGQGHTISNLFINRPNGYSVGLFGRIGEFGSIKNLGLDSANITGGDNVGGLIGRLNGKLENSYSKGTVIGNGECVGGLVGSHSVEVDSGGGVPYTVLNAYSDASVNGEWGVGGLVGCNTGDVINSYSTGSVTSGYGGDGGLIGYSDGGYILNSFWDTQTSGMEISSGGTGKSTSQMQTIATYTTLVPDELDESWDIVLENNFDFSNPSIWYIDSGSDYPRLYWEYIQPQTTDSVSDVTIDSAKLNGNLTQVGTLGSVKVYFQYRLAGGTWIDTPNVTKTTIGQYSNTLTSLNPNTDYEYRSVLEYGNGIKAYGLTKAFKTVKVVIPKVVITSIGLINNIPDKDSLVYYFTSTSVTIRGNAYPNSYVKFKIGVNEHLSQANDKGDFELLLKLPSGSSEIEYYAYNNFGSQSESRELKLIIGTENFPDWLLIRLGLLAPTVQQQTQQTQEQQETPQENTPPIIEDNEPKQEERKPVSNIQTIQFVGQGGIPMAGALVQIDGKNYTTDSRGEIRVVGLKEGRNYKIEIKHKGINYQSEVLGEKDTEGSTIINLTKEDIPNGIDWKKIGIYGGIVLLFIIFSIMIFGKGKKEVEEA